VLFLGHGRGGRRLLRLVHFGAGGLLDQAQYLRRLHIQHFGNSPLHHQKRRIPKKNQKKWGQFRKNRIMKKVEKSDY
jgi:hypothetical protein